MSALIFKTSSTVRLTNRHGVHQSFYVRERKRSGYLLEPHDQEGERIFHSDELILEHYALGRLTYKPFDENKLTAARRERSRKTWEGLPRKSQLVAERRELVVKGVLKAIRVGQGACYAMSNVPVTIVDQHAATWAQEDFSLAESEFNRRKAAGAKLKSGEVAQPGKPFGVPSQRTVWDWCYRYIEMGENVLALAPYNERKGNRKQLSPEIEQIIATYIDELIKDKMIGRRIAPLYKGLVKRLKKQGFAEPARQTFEKRLLAKVTYHQINVARLGKRAADERRDIASYVPDPDWVLQQVEIDHTLANVHLICDQTGSHLGRPWITVVLDRLSRIVLGCHVSFLPPSWATLSRAIAHAIWLKDLRQFPDLAGKWNHHGVFDCAYTDRGMDFISSSARRAGHFVGFDIANLPGFSPWLKGKIERFFGTMALQCFNYRDGITAFQNPDYNPIKTASVTVSQFKADIIRWIVEYNYTKHEGLLGGHCPNDIWERSLAQVGGVNPVPNVSTLRRMIGKSAFPKLTNHGMRVLGLDFASNWMMDLRERYDTTNRRFEVRYDPYDLRSIEFFDGNDWYEAYCRRPDIAEGVTAWQHIFHMRMAQQLAGSNHITADMVARVRQSCADDLDRLRHQLGRSKLRTNGSRLAQYLDVGQFLTPISFIASPPQPAPLVIPGATKLDAGRYLVQPDRDSQPVAALPAPVANLLADRAIGTPALAPESPKSADQTAAADPSVYDRLHARLKAERKARGAK